MFRNLFHSQRVRVAFLVAALTVFCCVAAMAQSSGPTYPTIDYTTAAQAILTSVGGIFTSVAPYAAGLMALFIGWTVFKRLAHSGAH